MPSTDDRVDPPFTLPGSNPEDLCACRNLSDGVDTLAFVSSTFGAEPVSNPYPPPPPGQHPPPPPGQYPRQGGQPYFPQQPKKSRVLLYVVLAVVVGFILLCGGCLAVVAGMDDGSDDVGDEAPSDAPTTVVSNGELEPTEAPETAVLPDTPQAYSALTVIGKRKALPRGTDGEVTVVAISEPDGGTSFPFILHNGTDTPISRIEVSGRAKGPDGTTLGTGASQTVEPNVVLPDGYAIGYVYIDTSAFELPAGSSIPDLRIQFTEGLGDFENIIALDVKNVEQLATGDLTGDVTNPHDIVVEGPIGVLSACLTADGTVLRRDGFTDGDTVPPGGSVTWTMSSYGDAPEQCAVRLVGASGFE